MYNDAMELKKSINNFLTSDFMNGIYSSWKKIYISMLRIQKKLGCTQIKISYRRI